MSLAGVTPRLTSATVRLSSDSSSPVTNQNRRANARALSDRPDLLSVRRAAGLDPDLDRSGLRCHTNGVVGRYRSLVVRRHDSALLDRGTRLRADQKRVRRRKLLPDEPECPRTNGGVPGHDVRAPAARTVRTSPLGSALEGSNPAVQRRDRRARAVGRPRTSGTRRSAAEVPEPERRRIPRGARDDADAGRTPAGAQDRRSIGEVAVPRRRFDRSPVPPAGAASGRSPEGRRRRESGLAVPATSRNSACTSRCRRSESPSCWNSRNGGTSRFAWHWTRFASISSKTGDA